MPNQISKRLLPQAVLYVLLPRSSCISMRLVIGSSRCCRQLRNQFGAHIDKGQEIHLFSGHQENTVVSNVDGLGKSAFTFWFLKNNLRCT